MDLDDLELKHPKYFLTTVFILGTVEIYFIFSLLYPSF